MKITGEIFESYMNYKYKAYLKFSGRSGNKTNYEILQTELQDSFESTVTQLGLRRTADGRGSDGRDFRDCQSAADCRD
jgi:hypothetical protein